ncbi:hypothetical protein LEP1GSC060_1735 [Leptospira weilii serovar Ranarum str. ICFT]|uniref:Uncharacterized protein n=1 Tax=Leptospira weilii serovar Ranarum str. ICFT TaxID=1218598 RepID=N1WGG0_9LEPT|nr:hypothetical protein LEP1GSC060_1735 [Leptospira weilii serovar Ranarum str. ICFT]
MEFQPAVEIKDFRTFKSQKNRGNFPELKLRISIGIFRFRIGSCGFEKVALNAKWKTRHSYFNLGI